MAMPLKDEEKLLHLCLLKYTYLKTELTSWDITNVYFKSNY